jgi:hypothetical protein
VATTARRNATRLREQCASVVLRAWRRRAGVLWRGQAS